MVTHPALGMSLGVLGGSDPRPCEDVEAIVPNLPLSLVGGRLATCAQPLRIGGGASCDKGSRVLGRLRDLGGLLLRGTAGRRADVRRAGPIGCLAREPSFVRITGRLRRQRLPRRAERHAVSAAGVASWFSPPADVRGTCLTRR